MRGQAAKTNLLGFAAVAIALLVYFLTANPSVTFTDAGELAAVASTLGIAHPTGYPLFTLLGHLWTKLPFPLSPVRKMNLFAALCTALSVFLFYRIMLELLGRSSGAAAPADRRQTLIAAATALTYAFARTVWEQATSTEVYSLHLLMLQASILLFLRAERLRQWLLWALVLGLSFSNHLTTILIAPATIYLFFKRMGIRRPAFVLIAKMALPFAAGLCLYLYLPLRSAPWFPFQHLGIPEFDWGRVCRGLDKFFQHVSGAQYRVWMFSSGEWPTQLKTFFALTPYQLAWIGIPLFIVGLWKLQRAAKRTFWFLILLIVGCVFYSMNYSIHDISSYFLLAWVASLWLVGIGLDALAARWKSTLVLSGVLPLMAFALNFRVNNHSKDYLVLDYTRNLVDNLEPNAILISAQWDFFCSDFWYLQRVEGYRPDVVLIEKELLRRTWYPLQLRRWYPQTVARSEWELALFEEDLQLFESGKPYEPARIQTRFVEFLNSVVERNIAEQPVYVTIDVLQTEPGVAAGYRKLPQGFALRLVKAGQTPPTLKSRFDLDRFLQSPTDLDDEMQRGIVGIAAASVELAGRYAAATEGAAEAGKLRELAKKLRQATDGGGAGSGSR